MVENSRMLAEILSWWWCGIISAFQLKVALQSSNWKTHLTVNKVKGRKAAVFCSCACLIEGKFYSVLPHMALINWVKRIYSYFFYPMVFYELLAFIQFIPITLTCFFFFTWGFCWYVPHSKFLYPLQQTLFLLYSPKYWILVSPSAVLLIGYAWTISQTHKVRNKNKKKLFATFAITNHFKQWMINL